MKSSIGGRVLTGAAIAALLTLSGVSFAADYTQRLTGDQKVDMSNYIPAQAVRGGGVCGDGVLDAGEICDDNGAAGGCSDMCDSVDYGFSCTLPGEPIVDLVGNAVADGGFEVGSPSADWTEMSTNFGTPLCTVGICGAGGGTGPASGSWWAWFGGIGALESASVAQSVVIPSSGTEMTFELEIPACDPDPDLGDFLEVRIDGTVVARYDNTDPACEAIGYVTQTIDLVSAPGGPYNDDLAHTILFESSVCQTACAGTTNFFVDEVNIGGTIQVIPDPSVCTDGCAPVPGGDFENGLGDWTVFNNNAVTADFNWTTSDADTGITCGGGGGAPGNWTGLTGNSACIDSDSAGGGSGDVDAYLCSPAVNLSATTGATLTFGYDYQLFGTPAADDFFEVLVGTATPVDSAALAGYTSQSIVPVDIGGIPVGSDPDGGRDNTLGASASIDISTFDGESTVHVCYRYGGNFDWYGQIDDVQISGLGGSCNDADLDGFANSVDNCTQVPQVAGPGNALDGTFGDCDTDNDGFGNACDADLTQSGQVVFLDLFAFKDLFGAAGIGSAADLNCSGSVVSFDDLARFGELFGTNPGPSGLNP